MPRRKADIPPFCRVWVVGGQGQGKSTLVRRIARVYGLPKFDEVASTEIARTGRSFDEIRTDLDAVTELQENVFEAQLKIGAGLRRFVSDRAFENLCYAAESAETGTAGRLWESPACRRYVRGIARDVRAKRGVVFFIRPGIDAGLSGNALRSKADLLDGGVDRIDGMCKLILELGRVEYVPIRTANFQERMSIVHGVLRHMV